MQNVKSEDLVQCPYEKSHLILKTRFQVHLVRCQRQHMHIKLVDCPFDVTHKMKAGELKEHVDSCPSRTTYENFKNRENKPRLDMLEGQRERVMVHSVPGNADWDDLEPVPTYNPAAYAANANVLRSMTFGSKAEKKQFRIDERARLLKIKK